jgi:hypothetical protein
VSSEGGNRRILLLSLRWWTSYPSPFSHGVFEETDYLEEGKVKEYN